MCYRSWRHLLALSSVRSRHPWSCLMTFTASYRPICSVRKMSWNSTLHSTATTIPSTALNQSADCLHLTTHSLKQSFDCKTSGDLFSEVLMFVLRISVSWDATETVENKTILSSRTTHSLQAAACPFEVHTSWMFCNYCSVTWSLAMWLVSKCNSSCGMHRGTITSYSD